MGNFDLPISPPPRFCPQRGFTYLLLLVAIAALGASLALAGVRWDTEARREKEEQLAFVGNEYQRAIALYYYRTPGAARAYPKSFDDLLEDRRYPTIQRYLRQAYPDPITGSSTWGIIVAPDGGIKGVYSLSKGSPIRRQIAVKGTESPSSINTYADWRFEFEPVEAAAIPPRR